MIDFEIAITASFKILFVYCAMKQGNILFLLRQLLERALNYLPVKVKLYVSKPLYSCLFCMSSVWGFIFTTKYFSFSWPYLQLLFIIGGINYVLGIIIHNYDKEQEEENDTLAILKIKKQP